MAAPDEGLLVQLAAQARFYASLSTLGAPRMTRAAVRDAPAATPTAVSSDGGDLEAVRALIGDCQRCKLAGTRQNIVFGQGNPNAQLMFVGEAPGSDEDEQGLAFVG